MANECRRIGRTVIILWLFFSFLSLRRPNTSKPSLCPNNALTTSTFFTFLLMWTCCWLVMNPFCRCARQSLILMLSASWIIMMEKKSRTNWNINVDRAERAFLEALRTLIVSSFMWLICWLWCSLQLSLFHSGSSSSAIRSERRSLILFQHQHDHYRPRMSSGD